MSQHQFSFLILRNGTNTLAYPVPSILSLSVTPCPNEPLSA